MAVNFGTMRFSRGEVVAFDVLAKDFDGAALTDAGTTLEVVISASRGSAALVELSIGSGVTVEDQSLGQYRVVASASDVSGLADGTYYSLVVWTDHGTGLAKTQTYGRLLIDEETSPT